LTISDLFNAHLSELRRDGVTGFSLDYYLSHRGRFLRTAEMIPHGDPNRAALEIGSTVLFQVGLKHAYGYGRVVGNELSARIEDKYTDRDFAIGDACTRNLSVSVNVEHELFPFESETFDLVLCCEVLEHMDIDPMFMLAELNRITKVGGQIIITTPNCCSARNFWKIANGYRPHFFMQYERSRSPYRHNIEHDVHSVSTLLSSAGFNPTSIETHDVFEAPLQQGLDLLWKMKLPTEHRGDGIFAIAEKVSGVADRWTAGLYV